MKKRLILTAILVLMAGVVFAAPSDDDFDRGEWRHDQMLERMIDHLDLSRAQTEQIDSILDKARDEGSATRTQLSELRREIHETLQSDALDETAVRQRFAEKAALEAEAAIQRRRVHHEVMEVLNDEQRAQMAERREGHRHQAGLQGERRHRAPHQRRHR